MAPIPLLKLGGILLRTLMKPIAKSLKQQAEGRPNIQELYATLGQKQHRVTWALHMGFRNNNVTRFKVKDLPREDAIANGADLIGEVFIFLVAAGVTTAEYIRSTNKANHLARVEEEKQRMKQQDIQNRFVDINERLQKLKESTLQHREELQQIRLLLHEKNSYTDAPKLLEDK